MLPHSKRLTTELFGKVIEKGQFTHCSFSSIKLLQTALASRFSVSVPKKVAKTAVLRNKLRRRTYSCIRKLYDRIEYGYNGVIVIKDGAQKLPFDVFCAEIENNFVKTGILQ